MCGKAECRVLHRQKTQAQWRRRNRGYALAYRIDQRVQTESSAEPMRVTRPIGPTARGSSRKTSSGHQRADFIGVMSDDAHCEGRVPGVSLIPRDW
jgi:hypothetical protein